jgi:DNA-directed RNA polymerase subunit RPC12/RpoP
MVANRSNGNKCPACANKVVIVGRNDLKTLRPDIARQWDDKNNGSLTSKHVTIGSSRKVWWICDRGQSFEATVVARTHGSQCPYCTGKRPIVGETDFATVHPELIDEWDNERNVLLTPYDISAASHKEIWWRCVEGHRWKAPAYYRHAGSGCPVCGKLKDKHVVVVGVNDLATLFPPIADEWDEENNTVAAHQVLPGSNRKFWWRCQMCKHGWLASVLSRTIGTKCPRCNGKTHTKTRFIT